MNVHKSLIRRRGIALLLVLVFATIIFTMLKGLTFLATSNSFKTQNHLAETGALFALEAGFAHTINQLEKDPSWTDGFTQETLTKAPGNYSVTFNTSGEPFAPTESINNLEGRTPADSFLGRSHSTSPHSFISGASRIYGPAEKSFGYRFATLPLRSLPRPGRLW
jgi:hypothetical protein